MYSAVTLLAQTKETKYCSNNMWHILLAQFTTFECGTSSVHDVISQHLTCRRHCHLFGQEKICQSPTLDIICWSFQPRLKRRFCHRVFLGAGLKRATRDLHAPPSSFKIQTRNTFTIRPPDLQLEMIPESIVSRFQQYHNVDWSSKVCILISVTTKPECSGSAQIHSHLLIVIPSLFCPSRINKVH
jgi:hypothetical protein